MNEIKRTNILLNRKKKKEEALKVLFERLGPQHIETLSCYADIASTSEQLEQWEEAISNSKIALQGLQNTNLDDTVQLQAKRKAYDAILSALFSTGQDEEFIKYLQEYCTFTYSFLKHLNFPILDAEELIDQEDEGRYLLEKHAELDDFATFLDENDDDNEIFDFMDNLSISISCYLGFANEYNLNALYFKEYILGLYFFFYNQDVLSVKTVLAGVSYFAGVDAYNYTISVLFDFIAFNREAIDMDPDKDSIYIPLCSTYDKIDPEEKLTELYKEDPEAAIDRLFELTFDFADADAE